MTIIIGIKRPIWFILSDKFPLVKHKSLIEIKAYEPTLIPEITRAKINAIIGIIKFFSFINNKPRIDNIERIVEII